MKVSRALNWTEEGCGGSLLVGWILDRNWCECLLWIVRVVLSEWIEAWEVWIGGVQVSSGEKFGLVLGSVVRGILREGGDGFCGGGLGVWGDSGWMLVMEGVEVDAGISGEVWGRIWKRF